MSLRAVVDYVDYRLKQYKDDFVFRAIMAEYTATIGVGKQSEKRLSYIEERNEIFGVKTEKDERSAEEIIAYTFAKHGIVVKKKTE